MNDPVRCWKGTSECQRQVDPAMRTDGRAPLEAAARAGQEAKRAAAPPVSRVMMPDPTSVAWALLTLGAESEGQRCRLLSHLWENADEPWGAETAPGTQSAELGLRTPDAFME